MFLSNLSNKEKKNHFSNFLFFRFYRAHRPQLEDMTGIEGLFETLTTEAQEAANQHVKYKELGSCLPDYHKAANGTNGTTNGIKQTNGNGTNQSWADLLKIFLPPLINLKWIMKYKQTFKQDFCFLPLKIKQHQRLFQNNFNNFRILKTWTINQSGIRKHHHLGQLSCLPR